MLNRHHLTVVGTVRKNKREISAAFITDRGRDRNTSLFGLQEQCTLLSYVPKVNNVVLLLASMHNDDKIDVSTGDAQKPEMITFYNKTKGVVDVVDKLCASYTCVLHITMGLIYLCVSYTYRAHIPVCLIYLCMKHRDGQW